tara:strand:- start:1208 stop:1465 length:258 start_codon:yes stop_codon:yes gene_type:complete
MLNKTKNTLVLLLFISFSFLITKHYFSEENIKFTNKSRTSYTLILKNHDLPILKSDTDDIIAYMNDLEEFKKKRKKRIWEKLITE